MENWFDYQNNDVNEFIRNYRDSLQAQRDAAFKQLEQQRRNSYATIMGSANKAGMLYSTWPMREKIKYDTGTYYPARIKTQTSYQTGLDALRNNAVNLWNQIKAYREATKDLAGQANLFPVEPPRNGSGSFFVYYGAYMRDGGASFCCGLRNTGINFILLDT